MSCAGESDSSLCITTHQLLGNLVILGSLFIILLLSLVIFRYVGGVSAGFLIKKYYLDKFLKASHPFALSENNYLVQAFSSGILNPRLYN
jgi:hypothetical protein